MSNLGKELPSDAAMEKRMIEAAGMDFAGVPNSEIARYFGVTHSTLSLWRSRKAYIKAVERLKEEFADKMLRLASTPELRKKVAVALNAGIHRLIEIISSPRSKASDLINAVKLAAQLDGRLMKLQEGEEPRDYRGPDPLAQELLAALKQVQRDKETKETIQ